MDFSGTGAIALAIGVALAMCVGVFAHVLRLDRDRAFYPVVAIVVASYYALFALAGGSPQALVPELLAGLVFVVLAADSAHRREPVRCRAGGSFRLRQGHRARRRFL